MYLDVKYFIFIKELHTHLHSCIRCTQYLIAIKTYYFCLYFQNICTENNSIILSFNETLVVDTDLL